MRSSSDSLARKNSKIICFDLKRMVEMAMPQNCKSNASTSSIKCEHTSRPISTSTSTRTILGSFTNSNSNNSKLPRKIILDKIEERRSSSLDLPTSSSRFRCIRTSAGVKDPNPRRTQPMRLAKYLVRRCS